MFILIIFAVAFSYAVYVRTMLVRCKRKPDKTWEDINQRMVIINSIPYAVITIVVMSLVYLLFYAIGKIDYNQLTRWDNIKFYLFVMFIFSPLFFTLAFYVSHWLRSLANPIYSTDIVDDIEDYCLYLRPFDIDAKSSEIDNRILKCAKKICMPYAIGNPSAMLQSCEADRIYATDEEWKDTVRRMMEQSKFILFHVGNTNGFLWELETCKQKGFIGKSMFLVTSKEEMDFLKLYLSEIRSYIREEQLNFTNKAYILYMDNRDFGRWHFAAVGNTLSIANEFDHFVHSRTELYQLKKDISERRKRSTAVFRTQDDSPFDFSWGEAVLFILLGWILWIPYMVNHKLKKRVYLLLVFLGIAMALAANIITFSVYRYEDYDTSGFSFFIWLGRLPYLIFMLLIWGHAKANSWYARPWSSWTILDKSHWRLVRQAGYAILIVISLYLALIVVANTFGPIELRQEEVIDTSYDTDDFIATDTVECIVDGVIEDIDTPVVVDYTVEDEYIEAPPEVASVEDEEYYY